MWGWVGGGGGLASSRIFFKNLRNLFLRLTHKWFISRNLFSRFRGKIAKINSGKISSLKISSRENIFPRKYLLAKISSVKVFMKVFLATYSQSCLHFAIICFGLTKFFMIFVTNFGHFMNFFAKVDNLNNFPDYRPVRGEL